MKVVWAIYIVCIGIAAHNTWEDLVNTAFYANKSLHWIWNMIFISIFPC